MYAQKALIQGCDLVFHKAEQKYVYPLLLFPHS